MFKSGSGSHLCRLSERLGTTPDRVKKKQALMMSSTDPPSRKINDYL